MILPIQPVDGIAVGAAQGAVVGLVEHEAAFVVGEPDDELVLLLGSGSDRFLGDAS